MTKLLIKRHIDTFTQNDYKMNSTSPYAGWKLCPLQGTNPQFQYICYVSETCCERGCCTINNYKHFTSWYFWLLVIFLFSILYTCAWYCKRMEKSKRIHEREQMPRSRLSTPNQSPLSSPRAMGDAVCLVECLQPNRKDSEAPPKYHEALSMPKRQYTQVVEIHCNSEWNAEGNASEVTNSSSGVLPTYEDVKRYQNEK